ncbi:hypothetical protein PIB30_079692 [Stylosanthes scabra]|uniref:Uncharacterized protein n=1 Tax=Stylosanthes scabra TaxID=79078 RepID=A0ABU6QRF5_9FABA|nr:hypothetical protein [Stylosanthes scabra]
MESGPWSITGNLINMQRWTGNKSVFSSTALGEISSTLQEENSKEIVAAETEGQGSKQQEANEQIQQLEAEEKNMDLEDIEALNLESVFWLVKEQIYRAKGKKTKEGESDNSKSYLVNQDIFTQGEYQDKVNELLNLTGMQENEEMLKMRDLKADQDRGQKQQDKGKQKLIDHNTTQSDQGVKTAEEKKTKTEAKAEQGKHSGSNKKQNASNIVELADDSEEGKNVVKARKKEEKLPESCEMELAMSTKNTLNLKRGREDSSILLLDNVQDGLNEDNMITAVKKQKIEDLSPMAEEAGLNMPRHQP